MRVIRRIELPGDAGFQKRAARVGFALFALAGLFYAIWALMQGESFTVLSREHPGLVLVAVFAAFAATPIHGRIASAILGRLVPDNGVDHSNPSEYELVISRRDFYILLLVPLAIITAAYVLIGSLAGAFELGMAASFVHLVGSAADVAMAGELAATPEATHVRDSESGVEMLAA